MKSYSLNLQLESHIVFKQKIIFKKNQKECQALIVFIFQLKKKKKIFSGMIMLFLIILK